MMDSQYPLTRSSVDLLTSSLNILERYPFCKFLEFLPSVLPTSSQTWVSRLKGNFQLAEEVVVWVSLVLGEQSDLLFGDIVCFFWLELERGTSSAYIWRAIIISGNLMVKLINHGLMKSSSVWILFLLLLEFSIGRLLIPSNLFHSLIFMGNTNAENKGLRIYIETEKQFYNCGSSIEGVVFVEANENFKFDALYLRIEGIEWCQWFEGSSANRRKYTGSDTFYSMEYLLEKYEDQHLAKGKYAYPFSIELSENLPGSFESPNYDAKIEYKVTASYVNYNRADRKQHFSIPLIVREPFRQEISSYQGSTSSNPVTCGCFSEGELSLEANFQRNVCFQGEKVRVDVTVDNSGGNGHVNGVIIKLVQYTFISANNGVSRTYKKTLEEHKASKGIGKGEKRDISHVLNIPSVAHQTAISTLVANYFRIEVTADLGMFAQDLPSIYAPLFVLKKSFNFKTAKTKNVHPNFSAYTTTKPVVFRAPDYWFRKNRNLSVMNFRIQDMIQAIAEEFIN